MNGACPIGLDFPRISYVFSYLVPLSLGRLPLAVLGSLGSGLLLHQVVERSWQLQPGVSQ